MTRGLPHPWLAPTRTVRRTYAHARKEKVVAPSSPPNPKSAKLDPDTSTTARSAETLEEGKIGYLRGSCQKEVYGLILTPCRGRPRK